MKLLPCRPRAPQQGCSDGIAKAGKLPYLVDSWPGRTGQPLSYVCSGCKRLTVLTAREFNRLPNA